MNKHILPPRSSRAARWAAALSLAAFTALSGVAAIAAQSGAPKGLPTFGQRFKTANAAEAWDALGIATDGRGTVAFTDLDAACADADLIVESVPERLDIKHSTLVAIDRAAPAGAIIASSTSGFTPSELAAGVDGADRLIVGHPFNPVYLLPLVEVVASPATTDEVIERAKAWYRGIGMHPLHVRREIPAHIADRFLEAVWREALWLVNDGVATTQEIDDVMRYGFGLRWAQMGLFETYRIAGGEGGFEDAVIQVALLQQLLHAGCE